MAKSDKRNRQFGDSETSGGKRSPKADMQQSQQHYPGEYLGGNSDTGAQSRDAKTAGGKYDLDKQNDLGAHVGHDARYPKK